MARNSVDVAVNCDLTVSRETAEVCLKLIEYFINTNKRFFLHDASNDDGTISLYLIENDYCEEKRNDKAD